MKIVNYENNNLIIIGDDGTAFFDKEIILDNQRLEMFLKELNKARDKAIKSQK